MLWLGGIIIFGSLANTLGQDLALIFGDCHKKSSNFDACILKAVNKLNPYFTTGLPEYNVKPFDPHHAKYVELRRGDATFLGGFRLVLTDASEYGWKESNVTSFRTDSSNDRIVYSQYFPEKSLEGQYRFTARVLGVPVMTKGYWNMTLYDYSQTTSVTRVGGKGGVLKVRIEIDHIGDLRLFIQDLFNGKQIIGKTFGYIIGIIFNTLNFLLFFVFLEKIAGFLINNVWQPGFPFLKPLINELISTAFTDIFNESFRYFPIDNFIRD